MGGEGDPSKNTKSLPTSIQTFARQGKNFKTCTLFGKYRTACNILCLKQLITQTYWLNALWLQEGTNKPLLHLGDQKLQSNTVPQCASSHGQRGHCFCTLLFCKRAVSGQQVSTCDQSSIQFRYSEMLWNVILSWQVCTKLAICCIRCCVKIFSVFLVCVCSRCSCVWFYWPGIVVKLQTQCVWHMERGSWNYWVGILIDVLLWTWDSWTNPEYLWLIKMMIEFDIKFSGWPMSCLQVAVGLVCFLRIVGPLVLQQQQYNKQHHLL